MMDSREHLTNMEKRMDSARHLLPPPGSEVVGQCLLIINRLRGAVEAARALVDKMGVIHSDDRFLSVWTLHQAHNGSYDGPTYERELSALETTLWMNDA